MLLSCFAPCIEHFYSSVFNSGLVSAQFSAELEPWGPQEGCGIPHLNLQAGAQPNSVCVLWCLCLLWCQALPLKAEQRAGSLQGKRLGAKARNTTR